MTYSDRPQPINSNRPYVDLSTGFDGILSDRPRPTNRNCLCPICGDTSGKCRIKNNQEQAVLCANSSGYKRWDKVGEYICVNDKGKGHTSHTWVIDKGGSDINRRQEFNRAREQAKLKFIKSELSAGDRDKHYRLILSQLKLLPEHREILKKRGLTDSQIDECNYRTVYPYQKVKGEFPANLPGYRKQSRNLKVAGKGILCPIIQNDLIVGLELRLTNNPNQRFSLLSEENNSFHIYGEAPLAVLHSDEKNHGVWVVEGRGLKPRITNVKFSVPVLGSARYWNTNENHAKKFLLRIKDKYGTKIILVPDAGDILNEQVYPKWLEEYQFFKSQGFDPYFAWWGQLSKEQSDIDELADLSQVKLINIEQFKLLKNNIDGKAEAKIKNNCDELDWKQEYELKRSDRAKFKFTRKPDVEVKSGYLPTYNLNALPEGIIALKADWGKGKSYFTANLCKQWEGKILQVAHLNAILHNTASKYDLMHHHEAKRLNLSLTIVPRLAICDVTLAANFSPEHWAKGEKFILIWDEVCQGLKSLHTSKNLRGKLRFKARTKLEWLIKNATYIVIADRDLDDETLEYIERVRGVNKSFIIHHTGKKGKTRKPIKINSNKHKDEVLSRLIKDVKAGLNCVVACETKADLLALESQLIEAGIDKNLMFFAHGDNSNEPHIKAVIENIDIEYTNYQTLGYTMTMGTAVSLEREHFDKVYAFFTGDVLAASDQCQMLFRYRPDCEIEIWVSPRRRTLEIDPNKLLNNLRITTNETNQLITSIDEIDKLHKQGILPTARGEITSDDLPFIQHKLNIITRTNASKANPFQSLYDLLIEAGFTINLECTDAGDSIRTDDGEIHSEQKQVIKEESDRLVAQSELMNDIEFESAKINAGSLRKSERDRLQKTQLHRDTGLEITQSIVKLQRTKKLTQGARMLKVLLGDDATAVAYDLTDRERNPDIGDQNFYATKRRLLCELGVPELIAKLKDGWSYTNDSPETQEFGDRVRQRKADVKRLLGFKVSMERNSKGNFKISNTELLGRVLDSLCVLRNSEKDRIFGRIYSLNTQHWQILERIMTHMDSQAHTPTLQGVIDKAKAEAVNSQQSSVYSQNLIADAQQQPIDQQWLTDDSLQLLADYLAACENPQMLNELREAAPVEALKLAARKLPAQQKQIIKQWVTAA